MSGGSESETRERAEPPFRQFIEFGRVTSLQLGQLLQSIEDNPPPEEIESATTMAMLVGPFLMAAVRHPEWLMAWADVIYRMNPTEEADRAADELVERLPISQVTR